MGPPKIAQPKTTLRRRVDNLNASQHKKGRVPKAPKAKGHAFLRKRGDARRSEPVSMHDSTIWSNRPYGIYTMREAREHYHAKIDEKGRVEHERRALAMDMKARREKWVAIPEYCYKHEHPLRCGMAGKLYHKSDLLGPIVDSIKRLHERGDSESDPFNLFERSNKKKKLPLDHAEQEHQRHQDAMTKRKALGWKAGQPAVWACPSCATTDTRLQHQTKDALVCQCGYVVRMGGPIISTHRDKLGAEEGEDKTQHADRPFQERDKYSSDAPTAQERRAQRAYASKVTNVGGRVKGCGRLCDVQKISEQAADKAEREALVDAGLAITHKEETKGFRVAQHLDGMFRSLAPVEHNVKACVRRAADQLWTKAVMHCRNCPRSDCCELRLTSRNVSVVATAVFEITLERLIHGELEVEFVTRQHLVDLQARLQRSATYSQASTLTQVNTAKAMINIMQAPAFDVYEQCAPTLVEAAPAASPAPARPAKAKTSPLRITPFARTDSSVSCDEGSPKVDDVVQLRDTVGKVFLAHQSELPISVRDGAYRAIQAPGFAQTCKDLEILQPYSLQCVAFCVLNAVAREQANDAGPSFMAPMSMNVGIATKLELDLAVAEEAIVAIRAVVPSDATSEASFNCEDDLFA